jgi:hypothetical protein
MFRGLQTKRKSGNHWIMSSTSARYAVARPSTARPKSRVHRCCRESDSSFRTRSGRSSGFGSTRTPSWKNRSPTPGGENAFDHEASTRVSPYAYDAVIWGEVVTPSTSSCASTRIPAPAEIRPCERVAGRRSRRLQTPSSPTEAVGDASASDSIAMRLASIPPRTPSAPLLHHPSPAVSTTRTLVSASYARPNGGAVSTYSACWACTAAKSEAPRTGSPAVARRLLPMRRSRCSPVREGCAIVPGLPRSISMACARRVRSTTPFRTALASAPIRAWAALARSASPPPRNAGTSYGKSPSERLHWAVPETPQGPEETQVPLPVSSREDQEPAPAVIAADVRSAVRLSSSTTPPSALGPYREDCAPGTMVIRSRASSESVPRSATPVTGALIGTPSRRTRT